MKRGEVQLVNRLGLHARAAAKLVNLAKTFSSQAHLARLPEPASEPDGDAAQGEPADCKSIMSLLLLAAPLGSRLELAVQGEDEDEAFAAITRLIGDRFGEQE